MPQTPNQRLKLTGAAILVLKEIPMLLKPFVVLTLVLTFSLAARSGDAKDGDTLRVCYDLSGKSRPTEFKTKEVTQLFLVTYKREKP